MEDPTDRTVLLYVLSDGTHWKIGYSGDLAPRLNAMRSGNPRAISVLHTWVMPEDQAREIEAKCEYTFHPFMSQPRKGFRKTTEWYAMHPPILDLVKALGDLHGTAVIYDPNKRASGSGRHALLGALEDHPGASFM